MQSYPSVDSPSHGRPSTMCGRGRQGRGGKGGGGRTPCPWRAWVGDGGSEGTLGGKKGNAVHSGGNGKRGGVQEGNQESFGDEQSNLLFPFPFFFFQQSKSFFFLLIKIF